MKLARLLVVGIAIYAYIGVDGKPTALSDSAMNRIDELLDDIIDTLDHDDGKYSTHKLLSPPEKQSFSDRLNMRPSYMTKSEDKNEGESLQ